VKPNPKIAAKRTSVRKPAKKANGKRPVLRGGFAPELCGVTTGPTDLSLREGFGHG
jgi:hypothetical protein